MQLKDGISIIVTLYNKEEYIAQTLKSAITQINNNKKYQLIVVDDGSTDSSFYITQKTLKKSKIDYKLLSQKNSGPSIATNNALKHVKYTYIKLLDGDDLLSPDSLDYMKVQMEKNNIDLLYGFWEWSQNPSRFKFKKNKPASVIMHDPIKKFITKGWGGSSNAMIKTETMRKIKGCDETVFVQDFSIPLRVAGYHLKSKNSEKFLVGTTSKTICVGPKNVKNRIMDNNSQTLYDQSIVTLNFIDEAYKLNPLEKKIALKKIIARCWSWRKRVLNNSYFNHFFFIYLVSKLNFKLSSKLVRYYVYGTWISDQNIRKITYRDKSKKNILIYVGLDLLGDALLKIPFLIVLKEHFPNAKVTWFAGKGTSIFNGSLHPLSKGLITKIQDTPKYGSSFLDIFKKIEHKRYDIIIDTQKRLLTTLLLKRFKTHIFISPCSKFLFSDLVPQNPTERNLSSQLINLVEIFCNKNISYKNNINIINSRRIAICPGASVIWKRWPIENFIQVAKHLVMEKFIPVFILGPQERDLERSLIREFPKKKIIIALSHDPLKTIQISKSCMAGISNDTGCGHLIASSGIPVLTLFGPTDSEKFSPLGNEKNTSISSQIIFKSKNIDTIPVNLVLKRFKKICY